MWIIKRIDEADFGCEERLPGEPLMALVLLENEYLETARVEVAEQWLTMQELDEGDEWPEEIDVTDDKLSSVMKQNAWMNSYLEAVEEMDDSSN